MNILSRARLVVAALFFTLLVWASTVSGQPSSDAVVPPELRGWVPWVLSEAKERACVQLDDRAACVWPGRLSLRLDDSGGTFEEGVVVGARAFVTLPGGPGAWPENVRVDGRARPVLERDGAPVVELEPGDYLIRGSLRWTKIPEVLPVGQHTAVVDLTLFDEDIPLIKREGGNIWLKGLAAPAGASDEQEQVDLRIFRQIEDGIPLRVETLMVFQVAGKSREISFPSPLVSGTIPLSVEGDLAVALEPSGALRVQLVPGRAEVRLVARTVGVVSALQNRDRPPPWPSKEIWTFRPATELRAVELSGAAGIDASRTGLPDEWRTDSAYALGPTDRLVFSTTRRAQEQIPGNRLELSREFWLDENAKAFTVRDQLRGRMNQGWRLDLTSGELGMVSLGTDTQVITQSTESRAARGVEVRDQELSLQAVSRVERTKDLAAVGWSEDVDRLSATVRLPPGWEVFFVSGADDTSDTWISRWDLFSVFYVLLLTLAVARLIGPSAGVCAAIALVVSHGESGSPEYLWLPLVVFAGLWVMLNSGRLRRWVRAGFYSTAALLLIAYVTFAVHQVRAAIYPHLDLGYPGEFDFDGLVLGGQPPPSPTQPSQLMESPAMDDAELPEEAPPVEHQALEKVAPGGRKILAYEKRALLGSQGKDTSSSAGGGTDTYDYSRQKQLKPDAIVQTGPGIPDVSGPSYRLTWSGPVVKDHTFRLFLISPIVERTLTVVRLVFLGLLGWFVWRRLHPKTSSGPGRKRRGTAAAAVAIFCSSFFLPGAARADEPSDARLNQLKERLLAPPHCFPRCVSVSNLDLTVEDRLVIVSRVHVGAPAAYKLPGPASALSSALIKVDGKEATAIRLHEDGAYYLRLDEGVFDVELSAQLTKDRVTLDVGTPPQRATARGKGWTVNGINDEGRVEGGTLTLQRDVEMNTSSGAPNPSSNQVAVPPFFSVHRTLSVAVSGQVTTTIVRLSDPTSPEVLELPLLAGERLTTPGVEYENGKAVVVFPRQTTERVLVSTLSLPSGTDSLDLRLTAPPAGTTTETWELQCGVVWHCETTGLTATSHIENGHSLWRFHPWPGESLKIEAVQPEPAKGSFLTVHKATLSLQPGIRMSRGEIQMAVETSRATVHTVVIPKGAQLDAVEVDGEPQAVKSDHGKVRVALGPGLRRVKVSFIENRGLSAFFVAPEVDAGASGVNFRTTVDLPERRWLLLAGGPTQGPAVLLWGYLALIVLASFLLPRLPFSPLTTWQWLLLGLGLTQVPSIVAIVVAGWFFAVGSTSDWPQMGRFKHNLLSLGLIGYSFTFLFVLTVAVYQGLLTSPDMDVEGAGSYGSHLVWVSDRSSGPFPSVWTITLSIWFYRAFMLAWALWLSRSLLSWLRWAYRTCVEGRVLWLPRPRPAAAVAGTAAGPSPERPDEASTDPGSSKVDD